MLHRAADDLNCGSLISAACRLREAVRLVLVADCEYYDCLPNETQQRAPRLLLRSLRRARLYCRDEVTTVTDVLELCNKAAHCQAIDGGDLEAAICHVTCWLDATPYILDDAEGGRR
jgi:hypothetical protein